MKSKEQIKLTVEKTNTGFSAYSENEPVYTTGNSFTELFRNAHEAFELYYEDNPSFIKRMNITFEIDIKQFFEHYKFINASALANRIGMNPTLLSQYVNGKRKPSPAQTNKLLRGIHDIGVELTEFSLIAK